MSVYYNGYVSLFFLCVIPINVCLTRLFRKKIKRRYYDFRVHTENMSTKLTTMLTMIPVTKMHGLEKEEIKTTESAILDLSKSGRKMDATTSFFDSCVYVINNMLALSCLVFCSILAIKGLIPVGEIVLYQTMFVSICSAFSQLTNLLPSVASGFEALSSVSEIMDAKDVENNLNKNSVKNINGKICFENVCYHYPNCKENVVDHLNLDVKTGECIAVVGGSGSGKSTLMNLVNGLLQATEGQILVDDIPLNQLNLSDYRHHISVVPQNSILFSGSIRENITYGLDKYTEEDLQRVVEMANLSELIKDLPEGLNTNVGELGDKLSGGQKQRVTIARALIRNPKILILDEATSALDNLSEYSVQQAISKSIQGRTTFIVAHRLSTIRDANRIVVMENGKAVEIGTYDELISKRGKFYELKSMNERNIKIAEIALNS